MVALRSPIYGVTLSTGSSALYSASARSSRTFETSGAGGTVTVGSVRVIPNFNNTAPSVLVIFSFGGVP